MVSGIARLLALFLKIPDDGKSMIPLSGSFRNRLAMTAWGLPLERGPSGVDRSQVGTAGV